MADHPVLFSGPMIRALLAGQKTQTRRVIFPQPDPKRIGGVTFINNTWAWQSGWDGALEGPCPVKYQIGDRLWVRESWRAQECHDFTKPSLIPAHDPIIYAADGSLDHYAWMNLPEGKLRPSIFMPKWASRLTLKVTDVRVQRLQEITFEDALAEGIAPCPMFDTPERREYSVHGVTNIFCNPATAFWELWDSINGKPRKNGSDISWEANPWVVAYTFTVHLQNFQKMEVAA